MHEKNKKIHSILIIDDDQDEYDLLREALKEINSDVSVTYINNCEKVTSYRRHTFDLVLLDINMPLHDGFYWLRSIREHGYHQLPIIMYTNSLSPAHISKAYEEGANLFFPKPASFSSLMNGLRALVGLDWSFPSAITTQYCQKGNYKIFEPS